MKSIDLQRKRSENNRVLGLSLEHGSQLHFYRVLCATCSFEFVKGPTLDKKLIKPGQGHYCKVCEAKVEVKVEFPEVPPANL